MFVIAGSVVDDDVEPLWSGVLAVMAVVVVTVTREGVRSIHRPSLVSNVILVRN